MEPTSCEEKLNLSSQESQTKPPMSQETFEMLLKSVRDIKETGDFIYEKQVDVEYAHNGESDSALLEIERYHIQPSVQAEMISDYNIITQKPTSPDSYCDQMSPNLPESTQIHSSPIIPSNVSYAGEYDFKIGFQKQQKDTKSITWTYSETLHKLYVRMDSACPVKFKTSTTPPFSCFIRAIPIYTKPEHIREVVKRCPNHSSKEDKTMTAPEHLVRCEHKTAEYFTDEYTLRQSVTFPQEQPQPGAEWVTNIFRFMCFSSCVGGLNRRPIELVFTLEDRHGNVLGRQAVEVRICACPGRDRKADEKHHVQNLKTRIASPTEDEKPQQVAINTEITTVSTKRQKLDDDEVFNVTVRGRENYEIITRIRDSLELASMIPQQQKENMKKQVQKPVPEVPRKPSIPQKMISIPTNLGQFGIGDSFPAVEPEKGSTTSSSIAIDKNTSVEDWLKSIGMAAYTDMFHAKGFEIVTQLENFSNRNLKELKIGEAHQETIWLELNELRKRLSQKTTPVHREFSDSASSLTGGHGHSFTVSKYRFQRILSVKGDNDHTYSNKT
ncbi:DgyrCDS7272 [Dimorphilus gyrociliatus]|uniref:DgyrCDS7272 n=1 Tax=Dimorphilus gyrociliatus TaxID=2664684 RepID=A0A7I8VQR3_9ANNE|nr:DgyrCDS7272 [Dimorphilus gyrociliatus]